MPGNQLDFIVIKDGNKKPIGDIGFIGRRWVMIRAYFEDSDADEDGSVSWTEWGVWKASLLKSNGWQIARVAYTASLDPRVLNRDGRFQPVGNAMRLGFAANLVVDGFQSIYLKGLGGKIASMAVSGKVTKFVVDQGAEKLVEEVVTAMR